MKLKRITNPNTVVHLLWAGTLILLLVTVTVGITVIQPHTMGGDDYDDVLTYSYIAAGLLLPMFWMQTCGWWRQDLLNKKLQAKYDQAMRTYQYALPAKLVLALFLAMDAVRDQTGRGGWGVDNNLPLVDVRTYWARLDRLVRDHGAVSIIELAREGRAPFMLDRIPADERTEIRKQLRESVGAAHS